MTAGESATLPQLAPLSPHQTPTKLKWIFDKPLELALEQSKINVGKVIDDSDLRIFQFKEYGTSFMKSGIFFQLTYIV